MSAIKKRLRPQMVPSSVVPKGEARGCCQIYEPHKKAYICHRHTFDENQIN